MRKLKSFTLVEIIVVVLIVVLAIVPAYKAFIDALKLSDDARELSIAVDDAADILERIKSVSFSNLTGNFPNNTSVAPSSIGGFLLTNEAVVVFYPNGTAVDPLPINVTVSWNEKTGRPRSLTFQTMRTRAL